VLVGPRASLASALRTGKPDVAPFQRYRDAACQVRAVERQRLRSLHPILV